MTKHELARQIATDVGIAAWPSRERCRRRV